MSIVGLGGGAVVDLATCGVHVQPHEPLQPYRTNKRKGTESIHAEGNHWKTYPFRVCLKYAERCVV
eukprot:3406658-Rhodomonas_salina.3